MSWFAAFVLPDGEIIDGDDVASGVGWAAFAEWADRLPLEESWIPIIRLSEHGGSWPPDELTRLEAGLRLAGREKPADPSKDVLHVINRLILVLETRPPRAEALAITDGTGEDDEDGGLDKR